MWEYKYSSPKKKGFAGVSPLMQAQKSKGGHAHKSPGAFGKSAL